MRFFLLLTLFLISTVIIAQYDKPLTVGSITLDEIKQTKFLIDTTADAVLLYEIKTINTNITTSEYESEYYAKIKILKHTALGKANINIKLHKRNYKEEKVYDIKAQSLSLNENGVVDTFKFNNTSLYTEEVSDHLNVKKIFIPNVKVGSVIEYSYKIKSPFEANFLPDTWYFQEDIPFLWSELRFTHPQNMGFQIFYNGYIPLFIKENKTLTYDYFYRYVVKNSPAFKKEKFIFSIRDCISKLEFKSTGKNYSYYKNIYSGTWDILHKHFYSYEGYNDFFTKNNANKFENTIEIKDVADTLENIRNAFNYFVKNYKFNNENSIFFRKQFKSIFEEKSGNSVELSCLFIKLLNQIKINAHPVLLSTRENGLINKTYPSIFDFNHCIVQTKLGGKDVLMDVTEPNSTINILPEYCNTKNLAIFEKDSFRIINEYKAPKNITLNTIEISFDVKAGKMIIVDENKYKGQYAINYRNYLNKLSQQDREQIYFKFYNKNNIEVDSMKIENEFNRQLPINSKFYCLGNVETKDKIIFNPLLYSSIDQNPFIETNRIYPVDFLYPEETVLISKIKVPAGYEIESLPQSKQILFPDKTVKFSYDVIVEGEFIIVKHNLTINKSNYTISDYYKFSDLYNSIIQKHSEKVILKLK